MQYIIYFCIKIYINMAKKKTNKQPWSNSLKSREALYNGINPSADFDPLSIATQTLGYLGGFRTGQGMPEDEARWAAYLGLPYDKTYAPDTKIRFEGDENYPDRQYQGLSKRAKDEVRKKIIPQAKRIKDKYNKEWIQVLDTKPNSEYNDATIYHDRQNYLGDLGKFGIREVGESGIYEVGDKYDFPALIPIPNRNEGTELMVRDTIWSDRANPKLYNQEVLKRKNKFYDGGLKVEMPNFSNLKLNNPGMSGGLGSSINTIGNKLSGFASSLGGGVIGGIGQAVGGVANNAISGGLSSGAGKAISGITGTIGGALSKVNPLLGGVVSAIGGAVAGLTNRAFGSKLNQENINNINASVDQAMTFSSNAGDYDALASNIEGMQGVQGFNQATVGKDGWFSNKAKKKYEELKRQAEEAEQYQTNAVNNNASNIALTNQQLLEANYSAYGGPINRFDNGGPTYEGLKATRGRYEGLVGKPNEFLDNWNKARLATGRFDDQLGGGLMEAQKRNRDSAPITTGLNRYVNTALYRAEPLWIAGSESKEDAAKRYVETIRSRGSELMKELKKDLAEGMQGKYHTAGHTIFYNPEGIHPESSLLHEQTHASKARPQEGKIAEILEQHNELKHSYYDDIEGREPYARLMQVREANNIDPNKIWDMESLKEFKKTATDFNFLNRYSDDALLEIFNTVASNDLPKDNGLLPDLGFESILAAYGGPIHIKPSKRGTFTAAATKHGMGVQEFASKVLANKEDYSPAMVKKANFAKNASKWKHADGGELFTNNVTIIGNGGTHEANPYEGVQMGVDPQGIPNLVEEGEVIYDDYVFSNRLRVPKEVRQKYKLRGITFADAAKQLQKESEERPNDPISKKGLEVSMQMLTNEQEMVRAKKENNKYARGGKLGRLYDGTGGNPNWLYKPITPGFIPSKDDILAEMETMYPSLSGEAMLPIASKIEGSTAFKDQLGIKGEEQSSKVAPMKTHWLRYAPIVGSGLAVANDLFGGNEPDYSNANMFERAIEGTNRPVRARQIGNYLTYKPFDRDYYINKLNADTAAGRRAAVNVSGGNRAAAMAGILASDYNYGNQLGALARQAEEYNLAQRQAVEQFNRGTNVTNAEMAMKADMANAEQAMQRARMYGSLAEYRDKILAANKAEKSANLTNFIQGLGDLGTELTDKDKLRWLAELGVLKYDDEGKYTGKKSKKTANGGRITRKKRGGFTI